MTGNYYDFDFGEDCQKIGFAQPEYSKPEYAYFVYAFKRDKAIARENIDVNGDGDTDDEITLSLSNVISELSGSNSKKGDAKSAEGEFKPVNISILENGDYEIDGIQIKPLQLEQALTELKAKINHPKTILQIKKRKRVGESSPAPEHELLIKTLQKVGVDIEG